MDLSFYVNRYDSDGDVVDEGIFVGIGDVQIRVGTLDDLRELSDCLARMADEIEDADAYFERCVQIQRLMSAHRVLLVKNGVIQWQYGWAQEANYGMGLVLVEWDDKTSHWYKPTDLAPSDSL